jgi:hypothetical protein
MSDSGERIPHTIKSILDRYAAGEGGALTGSSRPIVEDRFLDTVLRASENILPVLREIAEYVWNELPEECHGSPEKVRAWAWRKEVAAHPDAPRVLRLERDEHRRLGLDTHAVCRYALLREPDGEGGTADTAMFVECLGLFASEMTAALFLDALRAKEAA